MLRVVDMVHDVNGARSRLLVLLVTEFVVASWLGCAFPNRVRPMATHPRRVT
jgi:hypothetical protein